MAFEKAGIEDVTKYKEDRDLHAIRFYKLNRHKGVDLSNEPEVQIVIGIINEDLSEDQLKERIRSNPSLTSSFKERLLETLFV